MKKKTPIPQNMTIEEASEFWDEHSVADYPSHVVAADYDPDADALYLNFEHPQNATDSEMRDDGILLRYREQRLVGMTILDASTRKPYSSN